MSDHEVTLAEYVQFMGEGVALKELANQPKVDIDWFEALKYCNKRSIAEGFTLSSAINKADATESVKPSAMQLKVYFGEMRYDLPSARPGTVLSDGKTYFAIATADGAIAITDLQLSGKKRMDVKSFLLGFRNPESYKATQGTSKAEIAKAAPKEDE